MSRTIRVRATVTPDHRAVLELPDLPNDLSPGEHEFEVGLPTARPEPEVIEVKLTNDGRSRVFPSRPTHPKLAAEHDAFEAMLPDLMKQYAGRYVAVVGGKVVAVAGSEIDALNQGYAANPAALPLVRLVTDQPQPIPRIRGLRPLKEPTG